MKKISSNVRTTLLIAVLLLGWTGAAWAGGGWPQPCGHGYFKLAQWWIVADEHYTDTGLKDPNITSGLYTTSFYGEYGFTDRLTGILYLPFFSRNYQNNQVSGTTGEILKAGEAINSLGDPELAIKLGLTKPGSSYALAVTATVCLPLGKTGGGSDRNLQTGDGEFNQMIRLDLGTSFGSSQRPAYANLYSGLNNRTNDFSDEFRYGGEIGVGLFDQDLWLIAKLNGIKSFKNGKTAAEVTSTSIFANNTEIVSLDLEGAYYLTPSLGVTAAVTLPLSGRITYAAPAYQVGVFFDLKK